MPAEFTHPAQVYFDEFDALGILHHARYFHHLERAQQAFFQHLLGVPDFDPERDEDIYVVVRSVEARFKVPVSRPGEWTIFYRVARIRAGGLTLDFTMGSADKSVVNCTGSRTVCKLSSRTDRPAEWSPGFRKALETWAAADPDRPIAPSE